MKRGGGKFGLLKSRSCPLPKCWGCSLTVGTYPQRVRSPPPLPAQGVHPTQGAPSLSEGPVVEIDTPQSCDVVIL